MPWVLNERRPHLTEQMDRDDCDPQLLKNTYRQFSVINLLLSQWKRIYRNELRPLMQKGESYSLLDVGFGGGDVPFNLWKWAQADGIDLHVTAIDTDLRAVNFAKRYYPDSPVTWQHTSSSDLLAEGHTFDFVTSNHLLHHLDNPQIKLLTEELKLLSRCKVIFNDIERSDLGYVLFNIFSRPVFWNSYITEDGLISIKRSFTFGELQQIAPSGWTVKRIFPFRLLLTYAQSL